MRTIWCENDEELDDEGQDLREGYHSEVNYYLSRPDTIHVLGVIKCSENRWQILHLSGWLTTELRFNSNAKPGCPKSGDF